MVITRCPVCGKIYDDPPAISRKDNRTKICPECGVREALEPAIENGVLDQETSDKILRLTRRKPKYSSLYDRELARVNATGNKWAIENFHATHD